jgi:predicted phosphodiesterase
VCPDFTGGGQHWEGLEGGRFRQGEWLNTYFRPWLEKVPAEEIVGIAGNHDYVFEHHDLVPDDLPWMYLEDDWIGFRGLTIHGRPWVPNLPLWAFYGDDRRLEMSAEAIPDDVDILLTHGPPFGFGDVVGGKYGSLAGTSVGDGYLLQQSARLNPALWVFGHIHEGRGTWSHGDSTLANVSILDEFYDPYPQEPMEFKVPLPKESS